MNPRFHSALALAPDLRIDLPPGAARHVQVRRLQPGDAITLFDGNGGEFEATIERMGRTDVAVQIGRHLPIEREAARAVHLAVGMPANERMDWLVEKATELGVASIQPLVTAHGVLRLSGERAEKKRAHWEAIAVAACEQCGRNRVPQVHPVLGYAAWLSQPFVPDADRRVLSLASHASPAMGAQTPAPPAPPPAALVLSGPEGGLSLEEEAQALARGFMPWSLGARVLRAETAAMLALARLSS